MSNKQDNRNIAAMREALEGIIENLSTRIELRRGNRVVMPVGEAKCLVGYARAALAAPARNVDRFKTAEDAAQAYRRETEPDRQNADCYWPCIFDWLFAPPEESKE